MVAGSASKKGREMTWEPSELAMKLSSFCPRKKNPPWKPILWQGSSQYPAEKRPPRLAPSEPCSQATADRAPAAKSGCAAWVVGQGIWTVSAMVLHHNVPSPGIADIGFVAAPVLWTTGILMFVDTPPGTRSRTSGLLEGLMIAGGVFLPTWALALAPVVRESGGPGPAQIVDLARPVLDLVVLDEEENRRPDADALVAAGVAFGLGLRGLFRMGPEGRCGGLVGGAALRDRRGACDLEGLVEE
mgnify:CR=1 FL=1